MPSKIQLYHEIVTKYEETYGSLPDTGNKPLLFNITGSFRNEIYKDDISNNALMIVPTILVIIVFTPCLVPILVMICSCYLCICIYKIRVDYSKAFDGEFIDINGRMIGVVVPTQEEEGRLESMNFDEINDGKKLMEALIHTGLDGDVKVSVASVGSTTTQFIYGQENTKKNEIEVGVDNPGDFRITELLDAQTLGDDDILVVMNSAGYALRTNAGVVYNDNNQSEDTISHEIAPRVIGGSGDNKNAMSFIKKLVTKHKVGKYKFTLAIVPRGDPVMPQGGSHTHQRILEAARHGFDIMVLEISGKQTKIFELMAGGDVKDYSAESICGRIKNKKILTVDGKTYGSGVVFKPVAVTFSFR